MVCLLAQSFLWLTLGHTVYSARVWTAMLASHTLAQLGWLSECVTRRWLFWTSYVPFLPRANTDLLSDLTLRWCLGFGHQQRLSQKHRLSHASGSSVFFCFTPSLKWNTHTLCKNWIPGVRLMNHPFYSAMGESAYLFVDVNSAFPSLSFQTIISPH